jgi:hypothetical protein
MFAERRALSAWSKGHGAGGKNMKEALGIAIGVNDYILHLTQ